MNNFDVTILTPQGDDRIKLIPTANNTILETSQSYPGSYKNISIELTDENLKQLRAWIGCYFKESEENKKKQELISNRMAAYEVYLENLGNKDVSNSNVPNNAIEYFNDLKNYLDFSVLAPELHTSYRHTVLMGFFKADDVTTHKLTLEFLMNGNSVSTILYTIESYSEYSNRYEFEDEGLKVIPLGTIYNAEDTNLKVCARAIKFIYDEFMETDYE